MCVDNDIGFFFLLLFTFDFNGMVHWYVYAQVVRKVRKKCVMYEDFIFVLRIFMHFFIHFSGLTARENGKRNC